MDHSELVATVSRRYMPRYKTESEVATMAYLRERTNIPVPTVYHYDANPYNRLGGEYILMSKVVYTRYPTTSFRANWILPRPPECNLLAYSTPFVIRI